MQKLLAVPYFYQTNIDTCGLAALSMELNYFGIVTSNAELEKKLSRINGKKSFHIADIGLLTLKYGFTATIYCYDFAWIFSKKHESLSQKQLFLSFKKWVTNSKDKTYKQPYLSFLEGGGKLLIEVPTEQTLIESINQKIPVIILVEARSFYGELVKDVTTGHSIVVVGYDEKYFYIHDPLDPKKPHSKGKNAQIKKEELIFCWYRRYANTLIIYPKKGI